MFGTGTRTTISGLTMDSSNVFLYGGFDPDTGAPVAGGSRIVGNRFTNLSGLQASFSPGLLVSRNVGTGVIQVDGGDAKTLISGNRLSGGLGVINVYTFDPLTPGGVQVVGNRVSGANGPGINVCCATTTGATPAGDVIRANTVTGSAEGIRVESSIGTRVLNNVTGSNTNGSGGAGGNGYGIHVTGSSRDVQVIGNRANNNQHEGIEVGNDRDFDQPADVTGTIVRDNIANFNGVSVNPDTASPGLRVRDPLGQVFGNTAVGNGNFFQIRATIGITGGGNHAAACAPGYLC